MKNLILWGKKVPPPLVAPPPPPGKTVPPHPPGDRNTTVHANLQAQKLQHKMKEFSIRCIQRAANVRLGVKLTVPPPPPRGNVLPWMQQTQLHSQARCKWRISCAIQQIAEQHKSAYPILNSMPPLAHSSQHSTPKWALVGGCRCCKLAQTLTCTLWSVACQEARVCAVCGRALSHIREYQQLSSSMMITPPPLTRNRQCLTVEPGGSCARLPSKI